MISYETPAGFFTWSPAALKHCLTLKPFQLWSFEGHRWFPDDSHDLCKSIMTVGQSFHPDIFDLMFPKKYQYFSLEIKTYS